MRYEDKTIVVGIDGSPIPKNVTVTLDKRDTSINDTSDGEIEVLNFTGFIIEENQIFVSFPKHYKPNCTDLNSDIELLFRTLMKHKQENQSLYLDKSLNLKTNFPFNAFFEIYQYYKKYGIFKEEHTNIRDGYSGKIDWKKSIRTSTKVVGKNGLVFLPLQIKKLEYQSVLLSELMIYAIDFTLHTFGNFLKYPLIDGQILRKDYIRHKDFVLDELYSREKTLFKDIHKRLVKSLIDFFEHITLGGKYFFKTYTFNCIWESMVEKYLNYHFFKEENNKLVFLPALSKIHNFKKATFHPNLVNKSQNIQPDHYLVEDGIQYIFDSKYYSKIETLNYKQLAYYFLLKDLKHKKFDHNRTINALILPGNKAQKIHFKVNPIYNCSDLDFCILEYYLDVKEAMIVFNSY